MNNEEKKICKALESFDIIKLYLHGYRNRYVIMYIRAIHSTDIERREYNIITQTNRISYFWKMDWLLYTSLWESIKIHGER